MTPPPVMTARLASTVLALEVFCVFFATLTASVLLPGEGRWSSGTLWAGGLALMLVLAVLAGAARRPGGIAAGSLGQVALVMTGLVVPIMWVVGAMFAVLWIWLVSVGRHIDADRRRWAAAAEATPASPTGTAAAEPPGA